MSKDKDIIFKLKSLDKEERRILAQKLGMGKKFDSDVLNHLYRLIYNPKEDDIMENFRHNSQNKKIVENFLEAVRKLKKLDREQLFKLAQKLEIEISSSEKEPVIRILEKGDVGEIGKRLNIKRLLLFRTISSSIIVALLISILIISPIELFGSYFEGLKLIAGWVGGMASIIGFFLVFSPEAHWTERIISCWTTNRLDLIAVLLFYVCYTHPDKDLVALMGGLGSILSVLLTLLDRKLLESWREKYFHKVYYGIVTLLFMGAFFIHSYILSGRVVVNGAEGNATGISKVEIRFSPLRNISPEKKAVWQWLCGDYPKKKECEKVSEEERKEKERKRGFHNFIRFCGAETDDDRNFFLRQIPFLITDKNFELEVVDENQKYKFTDGEKGIKIFIKKNLLEGKWKCSVKSSSFFEWGIEENENSVVITKENGDPPPEPYNFEKKEFLRFPYPKGLLLKEKTVADNPLSITIKTNENQLLIVDNIMEFEIFSCSQSD